MPNRILSIKRAVIFACLTLGGFLLAHTVNAFVAEALRPPYLLPPAHATITPSEPKTAPEAASPRALADAIMARGLFPLPPGAGESLVSGQPAKAPVPPLEVAKKVALLGTVFGQQGGIMAVIEELSTKKQSMYRIGEQIPAVGALSAIERDRVLFREGTQEEWLDLALNQQARSGSPVAATSVTVSHPSSPQRHILDRREIDAALADPTRLLMQAQAVPYLTNGKLTGFRLSSVMPSGFFDKIGLQTNDILQRINGVELRDPGTLLSMFQQLRNERTVRVDLVRKSQQQTLSYEIR
ncbi:type II secretion system protein GspC [Petrachloros mirabilis]